MGDRGAVAVLGGDAREWRMASRFAGEGFEVTTFGVPVPDSARDDNPRIAASAADAVRGAAWIVCPMPGMGDGDRLYAPNAPAPIALTADLLASSDAVHGGLVVGHATPTVRAAADELAIRIVEMAEEPVLRWQNAVPTSEAVLGIILQRTDRVLADLRVLILGTGKTATTLARMLFALGSPPVVTGRRASELGRLQQLCVRIAPWEERLAWVADAHVVVNTVPDPDAIPSEAYPACAGRLVIDTASPPGGLRHADAEAAGVDVVWARGLVGKRAPISAGDAQYEYIRRAMDKPQSRPDR